MDSKTKLINEIIDAIDNLHNQCVNLENNYISGYSEKIESKIDTIKEIEWILDAFISSN